MPPPFLLPGDGYLLRETAAGWRDEQRTSFAGTGDDPPMKSDPVLGLLVDPLGNGWVVGGWSGDADSAGRGTSARNGIGPCRARVRRGRSSDLAVGPVRPHRHLGTSGPDAGGLDQDRGRRPCPVRRPVLRSLATIDRPGSHPDRCARRRRRNAGGPRSPRASLHREQGPGRSRPSEGTRYAELLGSQSGLPVYPALGSDDVAGGVGATAFGSAFAGFPSPVGSGPAQPGISTNGIPARRPAGGARTHYAFDTAGPGGPSGWW